MRYTLKARFIGHYFYTATKPILKDKGVSKPALIRIKSECKAITIRAKDM